jgi:hypothetical protein
LISFPLAKICIYFLDTLLNSHHVNTALSGEKAPLLLKNAFQARGRYAAAAYHGWKLDILNLNKGIAINRAPHVKD